MMLVLCNENKAWFEIHVAKGIILMSRVTLKPTVHHMLLELKLAFNQGSIVQPARYSIVDRISIAFILLAGG